MVNITHMKVLNKSVIFFVLFFVLSCVKDEDRVLLNYDGKVVFICSDMEQVETKTTLSGVITNWVEGVDQVGVYSPEAKSGVASLPGVSNSPFTAQTSSSSSKFTGSIYWGSGQHTFYSYYPYTAGSFAETAVPVSLPPSQTQENGDDNSHIGAIDFMVARPQSTAFPGLNGATAAVSLRYEHLFTLLEFKIIRVGTIGSISKLRLKGAIPLAFNSGTVDITQNTPSTGQPYTLSLDDSANEVIVTLTNPVTPTSDYTTTPSIFMMVLPGDHTGNLKIGIESGGEWREISKTGTNFLRGKKYTVQVDADAAEIPVLTMADLPEVTIGTTTWANTNLGYNESYPYGLLYQWHRVNGLPYKSTTINDPGELSVILGPVSFDEGFSITNSSVFFPNGNTLSQYSWSVEMQDTWLMSSKFNPCPSGWRVPTKAEVLDLVNSGSTWTTNSSLGVEGMIGRWFGPNHDNQELRAETALFFPANGKILYNSTSGDAQYRDNQGYYFTSESYTATTTNHGKAGAMYFNSSSASANSVAEKSAAVSIRCVRDNSTIPIVVTNSILSYGSTYFRISASIESEGAYSVTGRGIAYNTSMHPTLTTSFVSDPSVGLGEYSLKVSGLIPNKTYYVRSYANYSGGTVYGNEYVVSTYPPLLTDMVPVEINGVKWSPINAGADEVNKMGLLYQWSRKYGQTYNPNPYIGTSKKSVIDANKESYTPYFIKNTTYPYEWCTTVLSSWDMTLYNPCPPGWRVPTKDEFLSLISSGYSALTSHDGMNGRWFGGHHSTDHIGSIFIPCAGYRSGYNASPVNISTEARYWTTTTGSGDGLSEFFYMYNSDDPSLVKGPRADGYSIRCVKE